MERNVQKNGLVNLVISLITGVAAFIVARYSNSLAGHVSVVFLGLGTLVAAVSWFQMRLEQSEGLEKLEFDELARTHGESALFETREAEVFPAQRAREQFARWWESGLSACRRVLPKRTCTWHMVFAPCWL